MDKLPQEERRTVITGQTLLPLGVVIAIVLALWRGASFLDERFAQLTASDRVISEQLMVIKMSLSDRWTLTDMRIWEQSLKISNPSLNVPDSMTITRRTAGNPTP